MRQLNVWFDRVLVGKLREEDTGRLTFSYESSFVSDPDAYAISVSLPKRTEPFEERACLPFFDGLLPEARQRTTVARLLGVTERNTFSLLDRLGGEVAGALEFLPPDTSPIPSQAASSPKPLNTSELANLLAELPRRPLLAGTEGLRLSLAGAQSKLPVCLVAGDVCLPGEDQPTTHILKPAIPEFLASTENEAFAMTLAAELGLPTAEVQVRTLDTSNGKVSFLLVERYDRFHSDGRVHRLHQEDFCQALGVPTTSKYQSEGGPSFKACFDLIRRVSTRPSVDLGSLLDVAIFNVFIGNADAHGKNFSLLYTPNGLRLAPFYDLMSTVYYPDLSSDFAMKIGGQKAFERLGPLAWKTFASDTKLTFPYVRKRIVDLAKQVPGGCTRTLKRLTSAGMDEAVLSQFVGLVVHRSERTVQRLMLAESE